MIARYLGTLHIQWVTEGRETDGNNISQCLTWNFICGLPGRDSKNLRLEPTSPADCEWRLQYTLLQVHLLLNFINAFKKIYLIVFFLWSFQHRLWRLESSIVHVCQMREMNCQGYNSYDNGQFSPRDEHVEGPGGKSNAYQGFHRAQQALKWRKQMKRCPADHAVSLEYPVVKILHKMIGIWFYGIIFISKSLDGVRQVNRDSINHYQVFQLPIWHCLSCYNKQHMMMKMTTFLFRT